MSTNNKPWVRLHLERQSESSFMPPFIVGLLQQETMTHYVLSNVLEEDENGNLHERMELDFISKTYVWRCEILGERKPQIIHSEDYDEGGLG